MPEGADRWLPQVPNGLTSEVHFCYRVQYLCFRFLCCGFGFDRLLGDGCNPENQSGDNPAVPSRAARQFARDLRGGTWSAWLHDLLKPDVTRVVVCDTRKTGLGKNRNRNDREDARGLAQLLCRNQLQSGFIRGYKSRRAEIKMARTTADLEVSSVQEVRAGWRRRYPET